MNKKLLLFGSGVGMLVPTMVIAQTAQTLDNIIDTLLGLLNAVIPIILALAIIFFFWGLAKFILNAGDPTAQEQGRSIMIWGVIALFVIVTVWGLVAVLQDTFKTTGKAEVAELKFTDPIKGAGGSSSSSSGSSSGSSQNSGPGSPSDIGPPPPPPPNISI